MLPSGTEATTTQALTHLAAARPAVAVVLRVAVPSVAVPGLRLGQQPSQAAQWEEQAQAEAHPWAGGPPWGGRPAARAPGRAVGERALGGGRAKWLLMRHFEEWRFCAALRALAV